MSLLRGLDVVGWWSRSSVRVRAVLDRGVTLVTVIPISAFLNAVGNSVVAGRLSRLSSRVTKAAVARDSGCYFTRADQV